MALVILLAGCDTYLIAPKTVIALADIPPKTRASVVLAARRESDGKVVHVRNELVTLDEAPLPKAYRARVTRLDDHGITAIATGITSALFVGLGSAGVHVANAHLRRIRSEPPCMQFLCGLDEPLWETNRAFAGLALGLGIGTGIVSFALSVRSATRAEARFDTSYVWIGDPP